MSLPVIYRRAVRDDIDAAYQWYEARSAGLGLRLTTSVAKAVGRAAANPGIHPKVGRQVRATKAGRFPYWVYHRVENGSLVVLAVLYGGRHPSRWRRRA